MLDVCGEKQQKKKFIFFIFSYCLPLAYSKYLNWCGRHVEDYMHLQECFSSRIKWCSSFAFCFFLETSQCFFLELGYQHD